MSLPLSVPILLSLMGCQGLADTPAARLHGHTVSSCIRPLHTQINAWERELLLLLLLLHGPSAVMTELLVCMVPVDLRVNKPCYDSRLYSLSQ